MIGNTVVVSCGPHGSIVSAGARDNIQYVVYDLDTCNTRLYAVHIRLHHTAYTNLRFSIPTAPNFLYVLYSSFHFASSGTMDMLFRSRRHIPAEYSDSMSNGDSFTIRKVYPWAGHLIQSDSAAMLDAAGTDYTLCLCLCRPHIYPLNFPSPVSGHTTILLISLTSRCTPRSYLGPWVLHTQRLLLLVLSYIRSRSESTGYSFICMVISVIWRGV